MSLAGSRGGAPLWGLGQRPKSRVAGATAPVFSPFPGERGQGDRDIKSALRYKISFCFNLNAVKQRMDILPHIAAFFKYGRQVYH